ncbi:hypothetical protein BGZ61DRAFT_561169 [Ilyonectria robusta]|uniref:uncharacterized protein n=1 Tax=Ilyonectria robusta TaxID=1079257 RepID=UPI001E8E07CF|nr:uncharacterized protein BGZ61DRAFT_561169 [Ilyonectria robusta]KAH8735339.1 hypothetical protein BGZ61DRAFT_561169 [Ilyonectria robusta]
MDGTSRREKKVLRCFGGVRLACSSCGCRVSQSYLPERHHHGRRIRGEHLAETSCLPTLPHNPTIPHNAGREDAAAVAVPGAASRWPSHGAILLGPLPHFMPPAGGNKDGDGDRRVITAPDDSTTRRLDSSTTRQLDSSTARQQRDNDAGTRLPICEGVGSFAISRRSGNCRHCGLCTISSARHHHD